MACTSTCPTKDCESYGQCLRRKHIEIDKHSLANSNRLERRKEQTLDRFEQCVRSGLTPEAPVKSQIEIAERQLNAA